MPAAGIMSGIRSTGTRSRFICCWCSCGWVSIYAASFDFDAASTIFNFDARSGKQLLWILFSLAIALIVLLMTEPRTFVSSAYPLYIVFLVLLLVTIFVAPDIKGSRSWLVLGPVHLQPAEFAKYGTALALASARQLRFRFDETSLFLQGLCLDTSARAAYSHAAGDGVGSGLSLAHLHTLSRGNEQPVPFCRLVCRCLFYCGGQICLARMAGHAGGRVAGADAYSAGAGIYGGTLSATRPFPVCLAARDSGGAGCCGDYLLLSLPF